MKELKCKFCGKICGREGTLAIHERACSQNPESKNFGKKKKKKKIEVNEIWKQENGLYKCPYCGKEFTRNGICSHIICVHTEEGKHRVEVNKKLHSIRQKGHKAWNKGLTKDTDVRIFNLTEKGKETKKGRVYKYSHTEEERKEISKAMKLAVLKHPDSFRGIYNGGKVKVYTFNGEKVRGLWELDVAKYFYDNNIKYHVNKKGFPYIYKGEQHLYFPDFYLDDLDVYIEVKGFETEKDYYKWKDFPETLLIFREKEIQKIRKGVFILE